jgi:poly-gamma-glutamate synthesis protein (capsule biosynthesis protein)
MLPAPFVFDGFKSKETRTGWLLRVELDKTGVKSWATIPLRLDERGTPRRLPDAATPCGRSADAKVRMEVFAHPKKG